MQIGLNLPVMVPGLERDLLLEWCRRIDAGPFSSVAAGERIFFPNPEVMVALSAAATVTERVALQFSVLVLPMHATLHVAKQIATLDVLSRGRVVLGVGVGGREEDYRAFDAPYDRKRLGRLESQVALMRRAWAGEPVADALRPLEPPPVQPGGPPILAGAIFPDSIRRAARWADGISGFSFGPSAEEIQLSFGTARTAWRENGRERPPRLVTGFWYALGNGARDRLDAYLHRYLNFMGPDLAAHLIPTVKTDSAERLKDAIRMAADHGTDELLLVPTTSDPDEVLRVADLVGSLRPLA
jgi:alkanesulfonate monooxygenase SsuD/methylene tetrahydromethanopterin reductase-like flavin-dependent oxidoreductase (luciferase family)